jgi:hypothetical protein
LRALHSLPQAGLDAKAFEPGVVTIHHKAVVGRNKPGKVTQGNAAEGLNLTEYRVS